VGDRVLFSSTGAVSEAGGPREGIVEEQLPRRNCLYRPRVANVDLLVLVMALKEPAPDWQLASRLFVLAERQEMKALLCLNKTDLLSADELAEVTGVLEPFPYPYILTSALLGRGVDTLKVRLQGAVAVFAGPSGSGKSSLLNAVQPGLSLKTNAVSEKVKRGRHTTRTVELLPLEGNGAVVDTPGFSRLDFYDLEPEHLPAYFPEIKLRAAQCAFNNCCHINEPGCAVREAAGSAQINGLRYEHYKLFFQELLDRRK